MNVFLPNRAARDAKPAQLEVLVRDWAERECMTFDAAVCRTAGVDDEGEASIWDMPAIDSKRTVSLLVELEPVVGLRLPSSLAKRGGYATTDELVADLLPKIRRLCDAAPTPDRAAAVPSAASQLSPLEVLP